MKNEKKEKKNSKEEINQNQQKVDEKKFARIEKYFK